jgi:hypothetical protein
MAGFGSPGKTGVKGEIGAVISMILPLKGLFLLKSLTINNL